MASNQPKTQKSTVCRVNKNSNYTVMSNYHLRSTNLSLKAIGLLSKILSLTDEWDYSIAGLVMICKENETAIKSALGELKEWEYLKITKLMPNQTKSGRIEYVYDFFEYSEKDAKAMVSKSTFLKKTPCSDEQGVQKQEVEILPLEIQPVEIQKVENQGQLNTYKSNTEKLNTDNQISINLFSPQPTAEMPTAPMIDRIDRLEQNSTERMMTEEFIKGQIDYEWYEEFFEKVPDNSERKGENATFAANIEEVDMLVAIIVSVICSNKKSIRIEGDDVPHSVVKSRFMKLEQKHIEYVLKRLMLTTKDIHNPTAYITTALYNATLTCDFAESNELKNLDPALFIPERFHDEAFRDKYYEHTAFRPKR